MTTTASSDSSAPTLICRVGQIASAWTALDAYVPRRAEHDLHHESLREEITDLESETHEDMDPAARDKIRAMVHNLEEKLASSMSESERLIEEQEKKYDLERDSHKKLMCYSYIECLDQNVSLKYALKTHVLEKFKLTEDEFTILIAQYEERKTEEDKLVETSYQRKERKFITVDADYAITFDKQRIPLEPEDSAMIICCPLQILSQKSAVVSKGSRGTFGQNV